MNADSPQAPTVGGLLREAEARLRPEPISAPRLTVETLLAFALGRDRVWLFAHSDDPVDDNVRRRFDALVERRLRREPTHYLIGAREFYGLELEVGPGVLTPRPETEHLVEEVLARAPGARRIVDVGCGAGPIALALAHEMSEARVVGADISAEALAYTSRNARRHGLGLARLRADLLAPIREGSLDVVVSNPPYIPEAERGALPAELDYEPDLALYGGVDGLAVYRRLVPDACRALRPGGLFLVEMGFAQGKDVASIAREAGFEIVAIVRDLQQIERVLVARKPIQA